MSSEEQMNADEQLAALNVVQQRMERASGYGAKLMGVYCVILGLLIGSLAALLQVYRPEKNFTGFIILTALFFIAVVAISLAYAKLYRSLPRGFSKLYLRGFFGSMALYMIAVAMLSAGELGWGVTALTGLIVAAPLCITGIVMVRK